MPRERNRAAAWECPFSHVRNAIWAAKKLGKLYSIAVTTENEDSPDYQHIRDEILEITDEEYVNTAIIMPVGRAAKTSDISSYKLSEEPAVSACSMASFPVIFPNGNVIACIGPPIAMPEFNPLYLGNLNKETIKTIFDKAEQNFILHAIRTFGPKTLVKLLKDNGYQALLPKYYIEEVPCDVCFRLFSDRKTCDIIRELIENDTDFRLKTGFERNYYLHESEMIEAVTEKG